MMRDVRGNSSNNGRIEKRERYGEFLCEPQVKPAFQQFSREVFDLSDDRAGAIFPGQAGLMQHSRFAI